MCLVGVICMDTGHVAWFQASVLWGNCNVFYFSGIMSSARCMCLFYPFLKGGQNIS